MKEENQYFTYKTLSNHMGIPVGTLYSMVSKKQIPFKRITSRIVLFQKEQIAKWIIEQHIITSKTLED